MEDNAAYSIQLREIVNNKDIADNLSATKSSSRISLSQPLTSKRTKSPKNYLRLNTGQPVR